MNIFSGYGSTAAPSGDNSTNNLTIDKLIETYARVKAIVDENKETWYLTTTQMHMLKGQVFKYTPPWSSTSRLIVHINDVDWIKRELERFVILKEEDQDTQRQDTIDMIEYFRRQIDSGTFNPKTSIFGWLDEDESGA